MLRSIFVHAKKPFNLSPLTSGFCTNAPIRRRKEINDVRIVGTLLNDSFTLQSGTKSLTVRTTDSSLKYQTHNVYIKSSGDYLAGQRICVTGSLKTNPIRNVDGKIISSTVIKAKDSYVLENESGSTESGDINRVQLVANIASEIKNSEKDSSFAVATHYTKQDPESGEEIEGVYFHRVFVYEKALREFTQNKLDKHDRIMITGKVAHMTNTSTDGKKLYSGFVVADNIYRVARRNVAAEDQEFNAEN